MALNAHDSGRNVQQSLYDLNQNDALVATEHKIDSEPEYLYDPIFATSQIRLIEFSEIQPSSSSVNLSIRTFSLRDSEYPSYVTLSYVWGSGELSKVINISGSLLRITQNLFDVLMALSSIGKPWCASVIAEQHRYRYYWVDAICIDQNNLQERGQQVSLMGEIYSKSTCTLVWLGREYDDSGLAINLIRKLGSKLAEDFPKECVQHLISKPENKASWVALHELFKRPYWQRAWIRQEYVLSPDLIFVCGDHWCKGLELQNALLWLSDTLNLYTGMDNLLDFLKHKSKEGYATLIMGNPGYEEAKSARHMRVCLKNLKIQLPLLCLLDKSKGVKSTDARDRIFGFLGLASDTRLLFPTPGYTTSVSTVYSELVKAHVQQYRILDIICFGRSNRVEPSLPSWVPNWSGETYGVHYMVSQLNHLQEHQELMKIKKRGDWDIPAPYLASSDIPAKVNFSPDMALLSTSGLLVATIDGLGYARDLCANEFNLIQSCAEPNLVRSDSCNGSKLRVNIARALLCGRYKRRPIPARFCNPAFGEITLRAIRGIEDKGSYFPGWFEKNDSFLICGRSMRGWIEEWYAEFSSPSAKEKLSSDAHQYTLDAAAVMFYYRKRIMTTTDGRFGMAPHSSRSGDQVWVLFGCSVPVVLRQYGERWEFVGECYMDDFMDGQAIEEYRRRIRAERQVVLH
ncbi:unnamed protein product [Alternaria burnsii]|nr:unnamed protein product [Alternaria burnsii]